LQTTVAASHIPPSFFAPAVKTDEVMPHWPQTTPASTTASVPVKSD
jgi:hypothetical protein